MFDVGIDLGSRFVKVGLKKGDNLEFKLFDTVTFYRDYVIREGDSIKINFDILGQNPRRVVATGYGRNILSFANAEIISEIKAHFKGAKVQTSCDNFTLIDLGGQDSKVIKVVNGFIEDFIMNDKCAAGTGRFLEYAANILKMNLFDIANSIENPVKLNSTCAIFSESEIIGKVAEGVGFREIAAGVCESIAKRIAPLVKRLKSERYFISGGVGSIYSIRYFLGKEIGQPIEQVKNCQFNGCIGCLYN